MQYRRLGRSGLLVSSLALGTMIFGEDSPRSTPPEDAQRMVHRFLDAGGNHIDTANVYASGRSEEIVGQAVRDRRDQVILATKVRFPMGSGPNQVGLSRYHIQQSVEASLTRLNTDVIDLLYMHAWDPVAPVDESLRAFDDLVRSGKVRYIGVSNFKAWQLMKALCTSDAQGWERFIAAQYQYSLVERDIEPEFVDLCLTEGVGMVPWGPLGGGFLSGKYRRDHRPSDPAEGRLATAKDEWEEAWDRRAVERNWATLAVMDDIVSAHAGSTHSQVSLAWLLSRPVVSSVILGVRTLEQLEDNLGSAELELGADELERLDAVSSSPEGYPYRFLTGAAR